MQKYVKNVIDGENPSLAPYYFAENFFNHDRAPGEQTGLAGVTDFLRQIYSAFSGFHTTIEEQVGQDDFVVGRWKQTFKQTGSYLGFPVSGNQVRIGGITITRVRDGKILEEWEARDAVSLLQQLGVIPPLGPLDGESMSVDNKAVVIQYMYDVWNAGKEELVDQIFAPNLINNNLLDSPKLGPAS